MCEKNRELSSEQIETELKRLKRKKSALKFYKETIFFLIVVAAIAVIASMLFFPTFRITGTSMEPNLKSGEIVVCVKNNSFKSGDIIAFYYNNKILLKRVIGIAGDTIEIDNSGTVFVNGNELDEPYLTEKSIGQYDIEFPYLVPENRFFVMGDNRKTSIDSRSSSVGCIADEYVIGKVFLKIWPFSKFSISVS